jgi:hypothetical protein
VLVLEELTVNAVRHNQVLIALHSAHSQSR